MDLIKKIEEHYLINWGECAEYIFNDKEPIHNLLPFFKVLKFKPNEKRNSWIYATCGMSGKDKEQGLELFILAPTENNFLINLLVAIAHYYASGNMLGLGHTVNFGCAWYENSKCDHGLISLPYLDGPELEWLETKSMNIRFLWLIPITEKELRYKKENGLEALENIFEETEFNYIDPFRDSVV